MLTRLKKAALVILMGVFLLAGTLTAYAGSYEIYDDAGIFEYDDDYRRLEEACQELSEQVNVVVDSINGYADTEAICKQLGEEIFGSEPSVIFIINMTSGHHEIWLRGINGAEDIITAGKCRSITDNTYRSAKNGKYAECAYKTIESCTAIYSGKKIAEPMKYIVNLFIALMIGLISVYIMIVFSRQKGKARVDEVMKGTINNMDIRCHEAILVNTRRYHRSSNSSGGGGGGSHSGGGGGGGHSF